MCHSFLFSMQRGGSSTQVLSQQETYLVRTFLVHIITFIPRHCYACKQASVRVKQETILTTAVRGITSITSQWNSAEVKYTTFSVGVVFWRQDCPISGFRCAYGLFVMLNAVSCSGPPSTHPIPSDLRRQLLPEENSLAFPDSTV